MEAKNLRIGNYVNAPTWGGVRNGDRTTLHLTKVETISKGWYSIGEQNKYDLCVNHEFCETGSEWGPSIEVDCNPIKLTKEWLKNLGFKWSNNYNWWEYKNPYIVFKEDYSLLETPFRITIKPEYVHELQNLFFALTGTELELKNKCSPCG